MSAARRQQWRERLFAPVDAASVAAFRIAFGAIALWEVFRYFQHGWIRRYYVTPTFHFKYYAFEWVRPWAGDGMFLHFYVLGALALALTLGLWYRAAAVLFFVAFTHVFLLDQARYLNHFYLVILVSFLLIFVPAHRVWSLDALGARSDVSRRVHSHRRARKGRRRSTGEKPRAGDTTTIPTWSLWLLRLQVAVPYFYGGLAKINADWLRGEPLRAWMAARTDLLFIGPFLADESVVYLFAYGALLLDLLVAPALLWARLRPYAFGLACLFHLLNWQLFSIGIFPFLMIAATTLFFPADWPRQLMARVAPTITRSWRLSDLPAARRAIPATSTTIGLALLGTYVVFQLVVPLRHHLYPGDVNWTEEGHRFSWRMKLRDKESEAQFVAVDRVTGERFDVDWNRYLARWQYAEMANRPDMILQFTHHLGNVVRSRAGHRVGIHAVVRTSLNGRPPQLLIDPQCDLTAQRRDLWPADWILPMQADAESGSDPAE